ncbi:MAG: response regulator [Pseudomonadales bacterium]
MARGHLKELFRVNPGSLVLNDNNLDSRLRILLVEDDQDIAQLVQLHLQDLNADITHVSRGDDALQLALTQRWDLVILDLRLPGLNGLDVCRNLRQQGDQTPILMLTAKSTELDRVLGLELGADDYVTKPFSPIELVARVKAILRRMSQLQNQRSKEQVADDLHCGSFAISVKHHRVTAGGQEIDLTAKEFDLLLHFVRNPGQVFRRSELLDKVWGYGHDGYEHTVNSHINRLRAKISTDPAAPSQIVTVWGVGYKFDESLAHPQ